MALMRRECIQERCMGTAGTRGALPSKSDAAAGEGSQVLCWLLSRVIWRQYYT